MNSTETLTLTTPELRKGDTVLAHGLRCLLDTEPVLSRSHPGDSTFYVPALVLNRDAVSGRTVPLSYTRVYDVPAGRPTGEHRWTIQGNEHARWTVERPELDPDANLLALLTDELAARN